MPSNTAAWLTAKQARPLEVKSSPYPSAQGHELVVKNGAVAINPVDWIIQDLGNLVFGWLKYPTILGFDLAGEVVEVGNAVSKFKVGDRVIALCASTDRDRNNPAEGAFQNYTIVLDDVTVRIPDSLSYEDAAVLPLCLATAASGLFVKEYLALQLPTAPPRKSTGKTLLIWGGSTSVGSNAIQMAVAAGYEVITTASPKNFDYVKKLGASQVFDYSKTTTVQDIISAVKNKTMAGAMAIGEGSVLACMDILYHSTGRKFITNISGAGLPKIRRSGFIGLLPLIVKNVYYNIAVWIKSRTTGIEQKFVWGSELRKSEVGDAIFKDFLPKALEMKQYIAAPKPHVLGKGLEYVQTGMDVLKEGVSASKLVVSL